MSFIEQVIQELQRAAEKFPTWPCDPLHALAVLGEEYGELNKAMLQLMYEPHKVGPGDDVREEAIQTAAMAIRLIMSLDRYEWLPGKQHTQSPNAKAQPPPERAKPAEETQAAPAGWAVGCSAMLDAIPKPICLLSLKRG